MQRLINLTILILLITAPVTYAQDSNILRQKIEHIIKDKSASIGIAVEGYDGEDTLSFNGDKRLPMQSVFKFHLGLAVLNKVDAGELSLNQKINITKENLGTDLYSPIRDKYPNGVNMRVSEILRYTIAESDNIGCDILLKDMGGPQILEEYLRDKGIQDIAIKYNEEIQQSNWLNQFENWTTPKAANLALRKFYENKDNLLSKRSYKFLWKTMKGTKTGQNSIRGELPKNTIIAHKTGYSGRNKDGVTAALNDVGIVFLPNGKYFYLSVFVTDSKETDEVNQKIIADVAKVVWDYFVKKYDIQ